MTPGTETRRREKSPPWFWPSGLLLIVGILVCVVIAWLAIFGPEWRFANPANQSNGGFFNITPTAAAWKPSASQYCNDIGELNNDPPGLGQHTTFEAILLANSAPTAASHSAALRLYYAFHADKATQADINAVNSAYACPSTSTN
jgi:hypothetical protein